MAKITIEDISRQTGLSRGTVSRALNDRPDISELTKQRVLEACRELKYVPSHAARSLATGRRYAVAVAVNDLHCALTCAILRGVMRRARTEHYVVHVSEVGPNPEDSLGHLAAIINERVDALLLAGALPREATARLVAAAGDRPIVACTSLPGVTSDALAPDWAEAGRLAAGHILRCVRNDLSAVLFVHEEDGDAGPHVRFGFDEAYRMAGGAPEAVTVQVPTRPESDPRRLDALRNRLPAARGIVASSDLLAVEVMVLAMQAGREPGRDIAIMGLGNDVLGRRMVPALTTIDFGGEEIGQRALDLALQRLAKTRHDAAQQVLVPPLLVERASTWTSA
jgi:DNA-binding LacI/PurR family transcriptional regulator